MLLSFKKFKWCKQKYFWIYLVLFLFVENWTKIVFNYSITLLNSEIDFPFEPIGNFFRSSKETKCFIKINCAETSNGSCWTTIYWICLWIHERKVNHHKICHVNFWKNVKKCNQDYIPTIFCLSTILKCQLVCEENKSKIRERSKKFLFQSTKFIKDLAGMYLTMGISASEKRINKGKRHANKCHHCIKFSPRKIYNFD